MQKVQNLEKDTSKFVKSETDIKASSARTHPRSSSTKAKDNNVIRTKISLEEPVPHAARQQENQLLHTSGPFDEFSSIQQLSTRLETMAFDMHQIKKKIDENNLAIQVSIRGAYPSYSY